MPRKLGQHFLQRDSVLQQLATAACKEPDTERVVEIGPGRGALTRHLLPRTKELHALELDEKLAAELPSRFPGVNKLFVHQGDVLQTDLSQWGGAVITGNLPYYITSPIIDKFLRLDERFGRAVFLMQWEVAERIMAKPGTRDYGYLTVATQLVCEVELIAKVPPGAFYPPPKVDSGALLLTRRLAQHANLEAILGFARRCFTHKRKNLRNNLRPYFGAAIDAEPEANLRAEQLPPSGLIDLYQRLGQLI